MLVVDKGGNAGIGTATPATTLDVNGNAQFGSGATKSTMTATAQLVTPKIMLSKEGGYLVKMVNDSGATVTSGTVVNSTSSGADYGFEINPLSGTQAFGTVYGRLPQTPYSVNVLRRHPAGFAYQAYAPS